LQDIRIFHHLGLAIYSGMKGKRTGQDITLEMSAYLSADASGESRAYSTGFEDFRCEYGQALLGLVAFAGSIYILE
jgi:hypothetical protein